MIVRRLPVWWPLAALTLLAGALRFSTLDLQSFWYDEAFTPVHVLHASLVATLRSVVHDENTPPLWFVVIWAWSRIFGTGMVALRFPSALAGTLTVPVAWEIGRELAGRVPSARRVAAVAAAFVAVNPLFVWYSQEARAYALFVFLAAVAMLCFLRAAREPTLGRLAIFALSSALALLTHYFAVFLLIPMVVWLLRKRARRRLTLPAAGALTLVGLALIPLILAQGGHGTQWITSWALASRLQAIPQYYLTGYSGAPLGHAIELAVALVILAAIGFGLWRKLTSRERDGALLALAIAAGGVLTPVLLALVGVDYLAPRNVVAAMIPVSALIAVVVAAQRTGRAGMALAGLIAVAFAALSIDVDFSPRLQRSNWRGVARAVSTELVAPAAEGRRATRVFTTVELGSAPLEYYLPPLHNLTRGQSVATEEIDEIGYVPLQPGAGEAPAPGFRLRARLDVNGLIVFRFTSTTPRTITEGVLVAHAITLQHPEVLVPGRGHTSAGVP
jgi:4-amino-4-deoxy-L-arabinose transferase-like glycosyltransferase